MRLKILITILITVLIGFSIFIFLPGSDEFVILMLGKLFIAILEFCDTIGIWDIRM